MTDNRALWEMVENWRARYAKELKKTTRHPFDAVEYKICADELAAILERHVVVWHIELPPLPECDDHVDCTGMWNGMARTGSWEAWDADSMRKYGRSCIELMVRGKS